MTYPGCKYGVYLASLASALVTALYQPCIIRCLQADYLSREALHCGVKVAHDWQRLVQFSKVGVSVGPIYQVLSGVLVHA
jgi:hypothetical protein